MTYLRVLGFASAVLRWLMRWVDAKGAAWAMLADWDGHIAFRQIDYAERVREASPWRPLNVSGGWSVTTSTVWPTLSAPLTWATGSPTITARWTTPRS